MTSRKEVVDFLKSELPDVITDIKNGSYEAKNTFTTLLFPYVKSVVYKYRNTIDEDLDGLVNFIIAKLIYNINDIDLDKPIMSYITRTAINQAIDQHRKYTNNKANDTIEYQAFRDYDTLENLTGINISDIHDIKSSLSNYLDKEQVSLIELFYIENKTTSEIAHLTGNSLNYTTKAIKNARENFIRALIK